jgi:opacity protein-like surface antigen
MKRTLATCLIVGLGLSCGQSASAQGILTVSGDHPVPVTTLASVPVVEPTLAVNTLCAPASPAPKLGGQVFFRFGGGFATGDRGGEVFTDTGGAAGLRNDGDSGFATGFGFHLPLMRDPFLGNTLFAEVLMDYAQFSNKQVVTTTSALLGNPQTASVRVNQLAVVGSPKYMFDRMGALRPWVAPVGLGFYVNSPPTNNSAYLDVGLHFGGGLDYKLTENVSIGVDCRYHLFLTRDGGWLTTGLYLGFNF